MAPMEPFGMPSVPLGSGLQLRWPCPTCCCDDAVSKLSRESKAHGQSANTGIQGGGVRAVPDSPTF